MSVRSVTCVRLLLAVWGLVMTSTTIAFAATQFDPSPDDPRIVGALEARQRVDAALRKGDVETTVSLIAPNLVVNAPLNAVLHYDNVVGRFRNSQIAYEDFDSNFEFVGVRGDFVVIMGEEIARPTDKAPHAGKIVHRRFTDFWSQVDGAWKLVVRQATITSVE
jgi:Domain of unknown function (DUF4440)